MLLNEWWITNLKTLSINLHAQHANGMIHLGSLAVEQLTILKIAFIDEPRDSKDTI